MQKGGINFYVRVYIVQEYYKLRSLEGFSNRWIYERVRWLYPMSESTFYNYLTIPARRELKQRDAEEKLINKHLYFGLKCLKMIEEELKAEKQDITTNKKYSYDKRDL